MYKGHNSKIEKTDKGVQGWLCVALDTNWNQISADKVNKATKNLKKNVWSIQTYFETVYLQIIGF